MYYNSGYLYKSFYLSQKGGFIIMNPKIEDNGVEFISAGEAKSQTNKAKVGIKFTTLLNEIKQRAHSGYLSIVLHIDTELKDELVAFLKERGFFVPSDQNKDSVAVFWKSPGVPKSTHGVDAYKMFNEAATALKENQIRLKGQIDEQIQRGLTILTIGAHMVPPETQKKLEKAGYSVTRDNDTASYTIEW